jgi:hypothetical protein
MFIYKQLLLYMVQFTPKLTPNWRLQLLTTKRVRCAFECEWLIGTDWGLIHCRPRVGDHVSKYGAATTMYRTDSIVHTLIRYRHSRSTTIAANCQSLSFSLSLSSVDMRAVMYYTHTYTVCACGARAHLQLTAYLLQRQYNGRVADGNARIFVLQSI